MPMPLKKAIAMTKTTKITETTTAAANIYNNISSSACVP